MKAVKKNTVRGRPRSFDLNAALDRAVEVFWANGYDGADLDAITEAMGINRPSLYAAYGNKRTLFFKAVERYYQTTAMLKLPTVTDLNLLDSSFLNEAIVNLFYNHEQPRGCLIACALANEANAHEDAKEVLKELIEREVGRIERWAKSLISDSASTTNARCYANLLVATLHSVAIKASAGISREQISTELIATMPILNEILGRR